MILVIIALMLFFTIVAVAFDEVEWASRPAFLLVLSVICACVMLFQVTKGRSIDARIELYTEENTKIENQMSELVSQYMEYEKTTFGELKADSAISLVSLYPELKADTLVQKQVDVYLSNTERIRELKETKINLSNLKWWLYFGK